MPVTVKEAQESKIREEICDKVEETIIKELNQNKLSLQEMIWIVGKILIDVGSALEKRLEPISYEKAFQEYTNNPTIGNALISSGTDIHNWLKL